MPDLMTIPGLYALWSKTRGSPDVTVAVLDGLVDQTHPCFAGAALTRLPTLVQGDARARSLMSLHGTHVASLIFGQPGSPVSGLASQCRGLIAPVFADERRRLSQLDLARAIEQAVEAGAQVINVSGGQLTDAGEAEDFLQQAVRECRRRNVLLIAAAGNDGCECLHVPAALPAVLAVGAMDAQGHPSPIATGGRSIKPRACWLWGRTSRGLDRAAGQCS